MADDQPVSFEDLLHLTALQEVLGGFSHEMAQPLNAIMIASQVIQLRLEKSLLPEADKSFMVNRLELVASQVKRATAILQELRSFSKKGDSAQRDMPFNELFDRIYHLMEQQLIGRGISPDLSMPHSMPMVRGTNVRILESALVQLLAYGRDRVQAIDTWHAQHSIAYQKTATIQGARDNLAAMVKVSWKLGEMPRGELPQDALMGPGVASTRAILASMEGRLEIADSAIGMTFRC